MNRKGFTKIDNEIKITNENEIFSEELFENTLEVDFEDHLRKFGIIKWKTIFFLLFLLSLALIITYIIYLKIFVNKEKLRNHIELIILAILLYIPSLFYLIYIILIFLGVEGFNFEGLPNTNDN